METLTAFCGNAILPIIYVDLFCRHIGFRIMLSGMESQKEPRIAPELLQALTAQATASGLTVNDYLARLLGLTEGHEENAEGLNGGSGQRPFYETASTEEWLKAFNEWAASHDRNIPGLSLEDVSRESIYEDR